MLVLQRDAFGTDGCMVKKKRKGDETEPVDVDTTKVLSTKKKIGLLKVHPPTLSRQSASGEADQTFPLHPPRPCASYARPPGSTVVDDDKMIRSPTALSASSMGVPRWRLRRAIGRFLQLVRSWSSVDELAALLPHMVHSSGSRGDAGVQSRAFASTYYQAGARRARWRVFRCQSLNHC